MKKLIGKREGGIVTYIHSKMSKRVFPPCFYRVKRQRKCSNYHGQLIDIGLREWKLKKFI